jgi:hypothetical protein
MSAYKRKSSSLSTGEKIGWGIVALCLLPLLILVVGALYATLVTPFIAVAWNVGMIPLLAQFGVTLTSITLGTAWNYAWGILLLKSVFAAGAAGRSLSKSD